MRSQVGKIEFNHGSTIRQLKPNVVGSTRIICKYCKESYVAYKKSRTHCRKTSCRSKEIKNQLLNLEYFVGLFCKNKIEASIELRFPGNDKLSTDAKINSVIHLVNSFKDNNNDIIGVGLPELVNYFRPILWKGVKGNFVIRILRNGTIDPTILNETFTKISEPVVIGNDIIITGPAEKLDNIPKEVK